MVKRLLKITLVILLIVTATLISISAANNLHVEYTNYSIKQSIDPTTNFFTQKENEGKVTEVESADELETKGYIKVTNNDKLELYLNTKTMSIALFQKEAKYIWYSSFRDTNSIASTDAVKKIINSGVIIECFDSTTLNEATRYSSDNKECKMEYEYLADGFIAHMNFFTSGISFDVIVKIDDYKLNVKCDFSNLQEIPYKPAGYKFAKEYKLKSVLVFPYFGSENYEINGYTFIPDGSGALIRYENKAYDTAYIKRIYGSDLGLANKITAEYLKNQNDITMPIYGINHGYNQAAFICTINNGKGSTELHSYPYMYSNIKLNRTFFKFITRDKFNVQMATSTTGAMTLINSEIYTSSFDITYSFLNGDKANYVGMAKEYKKSFNLNNSSTAKLKIDVLAQDYKPGLFGKNYIVMTKYDDLKNIVADLINNNVNKLDINYIGYNNNGYVDNTLKKIKPDSSLGGKKDFNNLVNYLKEQGVNLSLYNNPIVAKTNDLAKKTIKMQNLDQFIYNYKSSIDVKGKYINPDYIYEYFCKNNKFMDKYDISSFTFSDIGSTSFSYRYKGENIPREQMINKIKEQMEKIKNQNINISLSKPNDYLFNYINSYYDANYESSKYAFITDTIPFVSLVLSGSVNMYSTNINYVSNYDLFKLRLIEYNIYPSYMVTKEATNKLRYANFEYLYTTEYDKWHNQIKETYKEVVDILSNVSGKEITSHKVIDDGVVEIGYNNGFYIYINYNDSDYIYEDITIPSMGYYGGAK